MKVTNKTLEKMLLQYSHLNYNYFAHLRAQLEGLQIITKTYWDDSDKIDPNEIIIMMEATVKSVSEKLNPDDFSQLQALIKIINNPEKYL